MNSYMMDKEYLPKNPTQKQQVEGPNGYAIDEYTSGAHKETNASKGRYDLIPPIALQRLARRYQFGVDKYGERNWEKGLSFSRYIDSGIRHFIQYLLGDTSEDHLAAVAWNAFALMATEHMIELGELPEALDDIPHR